MIRISLSLSSMSYTDFKQLVHHAAVAALDIKPDGKPGAVRGTMIDHVVVAGVLWMFLVAAVIFLALCRISNAIEEQRLARARSGAESPVHLRLRQVIQSEDRIGITLTVTTFIYTVIFAILLAQKFPPLR